MQIDTILVNIWSFGDLITNSSSEVYCLYDIDGGKQIYDSVKEMLHCLRPDINIDDHLDISIQPNEDYTFWDENDEEISVAEYYEQKFREWSADKSNEYILAHLEDFHNELIGTLADEYHDRPGTLELKIDAKTELGESLRKSIFGILYAFEYDDIYT